MKLSISLPDIMAKEIKAVSKESERSVSYWIQKAWEIARPRLSMSQRRQEAQKKKAIKIWRSLQGSLRPYYGDIDSVSLAHQAFSIGLSKKR